jgi:predicted Rossmann fold nucleotide-binding protein DprA/Smf involved in DNA uptake
VTPREEGFLLLTSKLGNPERKPLTVAQLRSLTVKARTLHVSEPDRQMRCSDLMALGCGKDLAERILELLSEQELLEYYLFKGKQADCLPITRVSPGYPGIVRRSLGIESPGCLWAKGDVSLLEAPKIALVGSRDLRQPNENFARQVGIQAARQGVTLVSGNARGADKTAQNACLRAGGRVISIVADELAKHPLQENILYVSESGFDEAFSAQRAISRNRCIHALGRMVFVAQAAWKKGGTWDGTVKNLNHGWSSVACFRDGSVASLRLEELGAWLIGMEDLADLGGLREPTQTLFDR